MPVLLIPASKSDLEVMKKAALVLAENKVEFDVRVCSAHRTPAMLDEIMASKDYEAVIAGAGLAAALPGVIAAKTTSPVIGVPLGGALEGLDALLSVIQMPPGIPVITTGVNNAEEGARTAVKILKNKASRVNLVGAGEKNAKAVEKASKALQEFGVPFKNSNKPEKDAVNICFVDVSSNDYAQEETGHLVVCCPTAEKETASDSIKLLQLTKKGVWVGLNRGENAALAAIEVLGFREKMTEYRAEMAKKVIEADEEAGREFN
ncbi:MAG TPA: AIR carboxylase family protein [archaeon]|nr:AIR carboxylase family protein [archaeon]